MEAIGISLHEIQHGRGGRGLIPAAGQGQLALAIGQVELQVGLHDFPLNGRRIDFAQRVVSRFELARQHAVAPAAQFLGIIGERHTLDFVNRNPPHRALVIDGQFGLRGLRGVDDAACRRTAQRIHAIGLSIRRPRHCGDQ